MSISGQTGLGNLIGSMGGAGQAVNPHHQQAQQLGAYQNSSMNTTGSQNTGLGGVALSSAQLANSAASWSSINMGIKTLNEQDLQHDAMKAPLSALIDMWTMRWQGEWVSETEFQEDDFWRLALIRLVGANKLEKHNLANSYSPVYRIIE